ncbi:4F2 cell-surface antigen heavy chain [Anabarilius grahami]|uniref:4F2 cell-surface antigen heavy chain n=1 Tax=Anabarilius grahami TaxID=495550 RepID=A0A3N0YHG4_ANAGA|nr:4F2 cell-surface antigen heavy chain [Anabarilius grahami]
MKDVELKEVDQAKQLMTREINGCVKVTVPENTGVKYGLSKDELIKIAGTAGWIRTRWALLVLFWLGWVGMLAGAIVIIVQAPRCKPIPEMNWWNEGLLYQISDVNAFSDNGLKGVEEKLDYLSQMKVKGLVLGPIHTVQADQLNTLDLTSVKSEVGTENKLESLLEEAHKKGISIVLNLTPNYEGESVWFHSFTAVAEKIKVSADKAEEIVKKSPIHVDSEYGALMGSVTSLSVDDISVLLNRSGVDLLLTGQPDPAESGEKQAEAIQKLYSGHLQMSLGWSLSGRTLGSLASRTSAVPVKLFHTLLFTLPGTPVLNAGDEVGLKTGEKPQTMWDLKNPDEETNATAKALQEERIAVRNFFKALSDLRGKERSLLHGEYVSLYSSPTSLAFLRLWDQSERFLTAVNWGIDSVTMKLTYSDLPAQAQVRLSTDAANLAVDRMVSLQNLELGPKQAVLLFYPYAG